MSVGKSETYDVENPNVAIVGRKKISVRKSQTCPVYNFKVEVRKDVGRQKNYIEVNKFWAGRR